MRPEDINYTKRVKHYIDISNGEVIRGQQDIKEYEHKVGSDSLQDIGQLLYEDGEAIFGFNMARLDTSEWPLQRFAQYGRWVQAIAAAAVPEGRRALSKEVLLNAARLGLGPGKAGIHNTFGTYSKFYGFIGAGNTHSIGNFDDWELKDYIAYIQKVGGERRPTIRQLTEIGRRNPTLPKAEYIDVKYKDTGGLISIYELAGYQCVELWDNNDYIDWGVKFMMANEGIVPTSRMADFLSSKQLGPSGASIRNKFDNMQQYQDEAIDEYIARVDQIETDNSEKLDSITSELSSGKLPEELFTGKENEHITLSNAQRITRYAKYKVLSATIPSSTIAARVILAKADDSIKMFSKAVKKHHFVTEGELESTALSMEFFDDIWPMNDYMHQLKIDGAYEEYYKKIEKVKTLKGFKKVVSHSISS